MKTFILSALILSSCSQYQPNQQPYEGHFNRPSYGSGYEHRYNRPICTHNPDRFNQIGSGIGQIVSSFQSSSGYGSAYLIGNLVGSIIDQQSSSEQDCMEYGEYSWDDPAGQDPRRDRRTREEQSHQEYYDSYDSTWRGHDTNLENEHDEQDYY